MATAKRMIPRPVQLLEIMYDLYPNADEAIKGIRNDRHHIETWDEGCYLPLDAATVIANSKNDDLNDHEKAMAAPTLATLFTWRMTKGVYEYDDTVLRSLMNTGCDHVPHHYLHNLPQWSVYAKMNIRTGEEEFVNGAFGWVGCDLETGQHFLHLLYDRARGFIPYNIPMEGQTIGDMLDYITNRTVRMAVQNGSIEEKQMDELEQSLYSTAEATISLLLYLCTSDADIEKPQDREAFPENPDQYGPMKEFQYKKAEEHQTWEVGSRLGPQIRSNADGDLDQERGVKGGEYIELDEGLVWQPPFKTSNDDE